LTEKAGVVKKTNLKKRAKSANAQQEEETMGWNILYKKRSVIKEGVKGGPATPHRTRQRRKDSHNAIQAKEEGKGDATSGLRKPWEE